MEVAQPIANNVLRLVQDNTPWTQSATLSTLQPGDTIVVTQRGGLPPINVTRGDSIIISNGIVHGASAIAVLLNSVSNSTVNKVNVIPGRGNLISSNADGIHFINTGSNNHIRNCFVTRTLDDALVMDSYDLATVASISGSRQITVNRTAYLRFSNGAAVNFVDPLSTDEVSGATIISQDPPDSNSPVFGSVIVDSINNIGAFASSPVNSNIKIEANDILDSGRSGIWVGELSGGTIRDNLIIDYDRYPELPLFGVSLGEKAELLEDFTHAVVIHYSQNVRATNNCTCR